MPQRLLRGVVNFEDGKATEESLAANFARLRTSRISWWSPIDEKLYGFIQAFYDTNLEPPTAQTITDYFETSHDTEALERLGDIKSCQVYTRRQYEYLLNEQLEHQNRENMRNLLKKTEEIVSKGLVVEEGRDKKQLIGVKDALVYFQQEAHDLIPPDYNTQTRGELRDDVEAGWTAYQNAKLTGAAYGRLSGINEIDKIAKGCRKGQMWIHAAFTSELKTTFALNWCYNLVTRYRTNVFYVSLEMPYDQVRQIVYVIHSANQKWKAMGYVPLDYDKVKEGDLTEEEETFYQTVLKDFHENEEHCKFEVWCPEREASIQDIRMEAELKHKEMEVGFIVTDHGGLVQSSRKHSSYTIELNSVLREGKKMALHFNGGEGVAHLMLFQLNREGKKEADKNEGRYKLNALSYANEAERSADHVTTTYLSDEHRQNSTTLFCHLKNRDGRLFAPFIASVNFPSRRIQNFDPSESTNPDMSADEHDDLLERMNISV